MNTYEVTATVTVVVEAKNEEEAVGNADWDITGGNIYSYKVTKVEQIEKGE